MMRLNEKTARDAKNVRAALGDALLPPLINIVIEYRWIDVAVTRAAAYGDKEHYEIYFHSRDPMLFNFAMERGIVDHIVSGICAAECVAYSPDDWWVYFVDRFSRQIAAFAKNGWYDAIDVFAHKAPDGTPEMPQYLLPTIMHNPPDDKKRYTKLIVSVVALGTCDGRYVDFDTTRDAIVEGIAALPESHRAATVDALEEIEKLYNHNGTRSLGPLRRTARRR